jgi:tRNA(His) 5'-end guanylyltransferase
LGAIAVFDCRVAELPTIASVADYFRWRSEDAHRNALNAHCYWALRDQGLSAQEAARQLVGMSAARMDALLLQAKNLKFGDLPSWQRRGVGLYWKDHGKQSENPKTGPDVIAIRRRIKRDFERPVKDAYDSFIRGLVNNTEALASS